MASSFSVVKDWFSVGHPGLVPIASSSGDTYRRVACSNNGVYSNNVNQTSGIWRNPSVTYAVKADTTVNIRLGRAAAAQYTGSLMTVSGYMICKVEIVTEVGKFPTVTISAVANEGANSVNNFSVFANRFDVSIHVLARSKAQRFFGAVVGGGYLHRCSIVATCNPVVCENNLMPCASDIVNGRYELAAETIAANGESPPTMAPASGTTGGFTLVDVPRQDQDGDFIRYSINARREMV